jgi:hypothetical protein
VQLEANHHRHHHFFCPERKKTMVHSSRAGVFAPMSSLGRRLVALSLMAAVSHDLCRYYCSAFLLAPPPPSSSTGGILVRRTTSYRHSSAAAAAAAASSGSTVRKPTATSPSTTTTQKAPTSLSSKSNVIVPLLLQELEKDPQNETILAEYMTQLEQQQQQKDKTAGATSSKSSSSSSSSSSSKHKGKTDDDNNDSNPFERLLGLYDVSFVKTTRTGDNPVGGKWTRPSGLAQRMLKTRRTFQHILPVNSTGCGARFACYSNVDKQQAASSSKTSSSSSSKSSSSSSKSRLFRAVVGEAVNVISLDALWGLLRLTVILRGDAIPLSDQERNCSNNYQALSPLAVRALFDAPRIILGKTGRFFNVNIGPKTSVILDTLYVDDDIRIGLGGRSGTRFIFKKCSSSSDDKDGEANEFRRLLSKRPMKKFKVLTALAAIAGFGLYGAFFAQPPQYYYSHYYRIIGSGSGSSTSSILLRRLLSGCVSLLAAALGALIAFSGGGIEANDQSVIMS